ncbi:MAG: hypothetical protein JW751_23305 [Polyangiaceae bacterium]|nr:hypothetical protein [Polyangiaceae bacterium]
MKRPLSEDELVGFVVFALRFAITVVPNSESELAAVRVGSLAWTLGFSIAAVLLLQMYLRDPRSRLFTTRWPRLVAEALWLLLAGFLVFGAIL